MLTFLTSALIVAAMFLTVLTAVATGFYGSDAPQGQDAMGLVVPLFTGVLAALAAAAAGLIWVLRGGLDPLGWQRGAAAAAAGGAALLLGLAIVGSMLVWSEVPGARRVLLMNLGGWILPMGGLGAVWFLNRHGVHALGASAVGRGLLALGAGALLAGLLCAAVLGHRLWISQQADLAREHAAESAEQAERARRRSLGAGDRLREDLAKYGPEAPLWTLAGHLPGEPDAELRAILIARALQVPHFESELRGNLCTEHGLYRHGAAVLIAEVPPAQLQPETWAAGLAEDARRTAEDIRRQAGLGAVDNDDLGSHVLAIARAAARLARTPELRQALHELRGAVAATPAAPGREAGLQAMDALETRTAP